MSGSCGTCAHWGKLPPGRTDRSDYYDDKDVRPCEAVPHTHDAAVDAPAVVEDASGYSATLLTRKSFGCVLFVAMALALMGCAKRTGTGVDNEATYCARLCASSGGVLVGWHVGHRTDCVCAPAPDGGAP